MKPIKTLSLVIVLLISVQSISAQQSTLDYSLFGSQVNSSVLLKWVLRSGSICNGIDIQHSTDSINFSPVGFIPGQCGDSHEDIDFEFTHETPTANTTNYYRLLFGLTGFSTVLKVSFVDLGNDGYLLSPNPATNTTTLHFNNDGSDAYSFKLINLAGKLVDEQNEIRTNSIEIETTEYSKGTYLFVLTDEDGNSINGKLLVL